MSLSNIRAQHSRFGLHPCGEGGEYETFTVDCPLFKKRIELIESEPVNLSPPGADKYSIVAYLRVKSARLVDKAGSGQTQITVPPLLDTAGQSALESARRAIALCSQGERAHSLLFKNSIDVGVHVGRKGDWLALSNIDAGLCSSATFAEEATATFKKLDKALKDAGYTMDHLIHVNLLLCDMSLFAEANAEYIKWFPRGSPPTRATVAVSLEPGKRIYIDALACLALKKTLHVQSLSYWAPANIGPYSQAASVSPLPYSTART